VEIPRTPGDFVQNAISRRPLVGSKPGGPDTTLTVPLDLDFPEGVKSPKTLVSSAGAYRSIHGTNSIEWNASAQGPVSVASYTRIRDGTGRPVARSYFPPWGQLPRSWGSRRSTKRARKKIPGTQAHRQKTNANLTKKHHRWLGCGHSRWSTNFVTAGFVRRKTEGAADTLQDPRSNDANEYDATTLGTGTQRCNRGGLGRTRWIEERCSSVRSCSPSAGPSTNELPPAAWPTTALLYFLAAPLFWAAAAGGAPRCSAKLGSWPHGRHLAAKLGVSILSEKPAAGRWPQDEGLVARALKQLQEGNLQRDDFFARAGPAPHEALQAREGESGKAGCCRQLNPDSGVLGSTGWC